jgi:hypothetical protein
MMLIDLHWNTIGLASQGHQPSSKLHHFFEHKVTFAINDTIFPTKN